MDNTSWTPSSDDNLLGLIDKDQINFIEATGIAKAELYIFSLDIEIEITSQLILLIHKIAFGDLYEWGGKWRSINVLVGKLLPPEPVKIINLIFQYLDNLNYKLAKSTNKSDHVDLLVYCHYEFVRIHPFNNGNGRTGRLLMNLVAFKLGYKPLELYYRTGNSRKLYIDALREADKGNFKLLENLIDNELIVL